MDLEKTQRIIYIIFAGIGAVMLVGAVSFGISGWKAAALSGNSEAAQGLYLAAGIQAVLALVFGLVGGISLAAEYKRNRRRGYLLSSGRRITAQLESIYLDTAITVNGYNPYVITCIYKDAFTGQEYRFKSHRIWDGSIGMAEIGTDIQVYVDAKDMHNYYVDPDSARYGAGSNIIDM